MHQHNFDIVIWRAQQQRVKRHRHSVSEDDAEIVIQAVIVRRCECGEIQREKLEYLAGQEPTTGQEDMVAP